MNERIAIAGSGAIACGLAITAAAHGEVLLCARSQASAARARKRIDASCERMGGAAWAERVQIDSDLDAIADLGVTFAIEAIAEDLSHKTELLGKIDAELGPDAILASTTSSLSVAALASASGRPDRFVALHVFNPVPAMKLVELAGSPDLTEETRARAHALCVALGKTVVDVPDTPGFVVNRLLFPYLFHAVTLMGETGLTAAEVDMCMTLGAGHPMGPLALLDFIGLDVAVAIGESIGVEAPERLRDLVADGALGRKARRGLLSYD